jgi:hypothetical protein
MDLFGPGYATPLKLVAREACFTKQSPQNANFSFVSQLARIFESRKLSVQTFQDLSNMAWKRFDAHLTWIRLRVLRGVNVLPTW